MKKTLFLVASGALLSLASCKKDRTCTCTTTPTSGTVYTTETTYFKSSKKNAALYCQGNSTQTNQTTPTAQTGSKTTCELK